MVDGNVQKPSQNGHWINNYILSYSAQWFCLFFFLVSNAERFRISSCGNQNQQAGISVESRTTTRTTRRRTLNQIWKILDVKDKQRATATGMGMGMGPLWVGVNVRTKKSASSSSSLSLSSMWQVVKIFCRIQFPSLWDLTVNKRVPQLGHAVCYTLFKECLTVYVDCLLIFSTSLNNVYI